MQLNDFADSQTLYLTLARMVYDRLRRSTDPARENALDPYALVAIPFEDRSAAVRNVWESAVKDALASMGINDEGRIDGLRFNTTPAADELDQNRDSVL